MAERDATIAALQARIAELEAQIPAPAEPTPGLWYRVPDESNEDDRRVYLWHVVPWMTGKAATTWQSADASNRPINARPTKPLPPVTRNVLVLMGDPWKKWILHTHCSDAVASDGTALLARRQENPIGYRTRRAVY